MDTKYYTPTIEEFHVGFEYLQEERTIGSTQMFEQVIEKPEDIVLAFERYNNSDEAAIEVKYLDQEDVESFGFKCLGFEHADEWIYVYGKGDLHLRHYVGPNKPTVRLLLYDDHREAIFYGEIKNKSELKKVLKMTGYGE